MNIVADRNLPLAVEAFGPLGALALIDTADFCPETIRGADALVVRSETKVGAALLDGSRVRFVGTASIGTDHLDLEYLAARSIAFANAPGCNSRSVMEYVTAALLDSAQRLGFTLQGMSIGVVGVGAVGSKVARAAEALGLKVRLNDPPLARATVARRYVPLDDLMDADILTLHVPLTKSGPDPTFHLFDEARFARLRNAPLLINTSRGAVVETAALRRALSEGRVRAAVLDVWEGEPAIDAGLLDRVLIGTAHVAGYSLEGKIRAVAQIRDALARHIKVGPAGLPPLEPPPADFPPIVIPDGAGSGEDILRRAISSACDSALDDRLLRESLSAPPSERPRAFAGLRTRYRVRREFTAWTVSLPVERIEAGRTLAELGFKVAFRAGAATRH
jgi:erythronate-4-phosphate dehydrogenase